MPPSLPPSPSMGSAAPKCDLANQRQKRRTFCMPRGTLLWGCGYRVLWPSPNKPALGWGRTRSETFSQLERGQWAPPCSGAVYLSARKGQG